MAGKKSDKIKIYITLGLAVMLLISAYFRIIRPRTKGTANATASRPSAPVVQIPKVNTDTPQQIETPRKKEKIKKKQNPIYSMSSMVRDIFAEPAVPVPVKEEKEEEKPSLPPSTLKGTIVGGENPVAIINGKFLRMGDWIGDYQVVRIDKNEVLLSAGNHEVVLEVLKNVHN